MAMRQTKAQLQAELHALKMENSTLRTQIDALRAEALEIRVKYAALLDENQHWHDAATNGHTYPHVDTRGRRYRLLNKGGRSIRCFQP